MGYLFEIDWAQLFLPRKSLAEILLGGVVVYLALCVLLRIIPKRQVGSSSVNDLLFLIIVGGVAVEGVARLAESLTDFLFLLLVILLLGFLLDWLAYHSSAVRRLLEEEPRCLVRDGAIQHQNLRREMMTEDELRQHLRRQGFEDVSGVRAAWMENDGEVSVIEAEATDQPKPDPEPVPEPDDEAADLAAFLAAAEKLRARLEWHQGQAARCKEVLAQHGVRVRLRARDADGAVP